jgi:hypothetical protein
MEHSALTRTIVLVQPATIGLLPATMGLLMDSTPDRLIVMAHPPITAPILIPVLTPGQHLSGRPPIRSGRPLTRNSGPLIRSNDDPLAIPPIPGLTTRAHGTNSRIRSPGRNGIHHMAGHVHTIPRHDAPSPVPVASSENKDHKRAETANLRVTMSPIVRRIARAVQGALPHALAFSLVHRLKIATLQHARASSLVHNSANNNAHSQMTPSRSQSAT